MLTLGGLLFCNHIVETVFVFQQHVIGVLQQSDKTMVEKYIQAMFVPLSDETIVIGKDILQQHGYTET